MAGENSEAQKDAGILPLIHLWLDSLCGSRQNIRLLWGLSFYICKMRVVTERRVSLVGQEGYRCSPPYLSQRRQGKPAPQTTENTCAVSPLGTRMTRLNKGL